MLQKTQLFQRAVFFAMINPQPDGAGFAGINKTLPQDLAEVAGDAAEFVMRYKAQVLNSTSYLTYGNLQSTPWTKHS